MTNFRGLLIATDSHYFGGVSKQIESCWNHFQDVFDFVVVAVPESLVSTYEYQFPSMRLLAIPDFPAIKKVRSLIRARKVLHQTLSGESEFEVVYWIGGPRGLLILSSLIVPQLRIMTLSSAVPASWLRKRFLKTLGYAIDLATTIAPSESLSWRHWWYLSPLCRRIVMKPISRRATSLRVGWFSRLDFPKRPDVWVEIVKQAQAQTHSSGIGAVLLGDGMYKKDIDKRARNVLCEYTSEEAMSPLEAFKTMDVLVFWSDSEGVPNVIQEAIWCGVPVVSNQLPGIKALLPNVGMGVVKSVTEAVALILRLNSNEELRQGLLEKQQMRMLEISQQPSLEEKLEGWLRARL